MSATKGFTADICVHDQREKGWGVGLVEKRPVSRSRWTDVVCAFSDSSILKSWTLSPDSFLVLQHLHPIQSEIYWVNTIFRFICSNFFIFLFFIFSTISVTAQRRGWSTTPQNIESCSKLWCSYSIKGVDFHLVCKKYVCEWNRNAGVFLV